MALLPELARQAIEQARSGRLGEALVLAKRALVGQPNDQGLMLFIGMLHGKRMELKEAAHFLRRASRLSAADPLPKLELARVLIGLNQLDEASALLGERALDGMEGRRLRGLVLMRRNRHQEAAPLFAQNTDRDPRDYESWGNLGVCHLVNGDAEQAIVAIERSLRLRRDQQRFRDRWAEAQVEAGLGEQGLRVAHDFARENPADVMVRVTIARLEDLLGRPERALAALHEALALDPHHAPALTALAALNERQNDVPGLRLAIDRLAALPEPVADLPLLRAKLAMREGDLETALSLADAASGDVDPGVRAQLVGQINDRLNRTDAAHAAFAAMNQHNGVSQAVMEARATAFRSSMEKRSKLLSRAFVRSWPSQSSQPQPDPIFVVGFPRSGTTLLDTLMMGNPQLCIAEEKPMLDKVASAIGGYDRLPTLRDDELTALRSLYFDEAQRHVPELGERTLVDKQPFAMIDAALIYRLFPQAKFVFVQRHPADAVLSCFITRFEPNNALANFTTLEGTARMYDEMMRLWVKSRAVLPLISHLVRYERLVDEAEAEMRALFNFLGLEWRPEVLDNQAQADRRGFISTPSYAQVAEPLNDRSIDRWKRYQRHVEPILPRLKIWADVMGYDL